MSDDQRAGEDDNRLWWERPFPLFVWFVCGVAISVSFVWSVLR
jgi:hypothetical protein